MKQYEATSEYIARSIVIAAGLTERHKCRGCGVLLEAYSREPSNDWSCPDCKIEGTTVAGKANAS